MRAMLRALAEIDPSDRPSLEAALREHLHGVARLPEGDRALVARAEADVRRDPASAFRFERDAIATLLAAGRTFQAGRFETPTLGELRRRAEEARRRAGQSGRLRFHVVDGVSPATDIGALQASAPPGSLFQVASQFNCLEAPGPLVTRVLEYFDDGTQGPRASISALPGTLLRHYAAPAADGSRFVQVGDGRQINLLDAVCDPAVARVRNGYLTMEAIARAGDFRRALEERFDEIRVGVHDAVEVVYGHDWLGPVPSAPDQRVAQVFTSTVAAGGYGTLSDDPATASIVRSLLRAAYAGTLLAAAALGKPYVVLTLIGGGVFANPVRWIWESILWAVDRVAPLVHADTCVVANGYSIGRRLPAAELHAGAQARGGTMATFGETSVMVR